MESGLLSLKAELIKKKSEVNKRPSEVLHKPIKKPFGKESESKSKNLKLKNHSQKSSIENKEEQLKLEQSRKTLLEKAALYDKIKNGIEVLQNEELNEKYLVDFQGKINTEVTEFKKSQELNHPTSEEEAKNLEAYKAKDPAEEWIEYVDSFGRSRMCMKKDLHNIKDKSGDSSHVDSKATNKNHEKWDKIEEESKSKSDLHYQDVLFDEARSHGAGFMTFSRDETERMAQQQYLKDLGEQTKQIKVSKAALKAKRDKLMKERLVKVRQRKRLKLGLPINDEDKYTTPPPSDEEDNTVEEVPSDDEKVVEETSNDVSETGEDTEVHVREWDIGKPGISALMSQKQWIESRRKTRESEFAPPSIYNNVSKNTVQKRKYSRNEDRIKKEEKSKERNAERCSQFAPPATYEYYGPSTFKGKSYIGKVDLEDAIGKGLSEIRSKDYKN